MHMLNTMEQADCFLTCEKKDTFGGKKDTPSVERKKKETKTDKKKKRWWLFDRDLLKNQRKVVIS